MLVMSFWSYMCVNEILQTGFLFLFFQAEDGIRDLVRSRGLGDVYKRQARALSQAPTRRKQAQTISCDETQTSQ